MKWINVNDRLPHRSGNEKFLASNSVLVLAWENGRGYALARYDHEYKEWNITDEFGNRKKIEPTHWMPLPDKPI